MTLNVGDAKYNQAHKHTTSTQLAQLAQQARMTPCQRSQGVKVCPKEGRCMEIASFASSLPSLSIREFGPGPEGTRPLFCHPNSPLTFFFALWDDVCPAYTYLFSLLLLDIPHLPPARRRPAHLCVCVYSSSGSVLCASLFVCVCVCMCLYVFVVYLFVVNSPLLCFCFFFGRACLMLCVGNGY